MTATMTNRAPRAAAAAACAAAAIVAGCSPSGTDAPANTPVSTSPSLGAADSGDVPWNPVPATRTPSATLSAPPQEPQRTVPTTPATPDEAIAQVDRTDPQAVATEAVRSWLAWRPTTDGGPLDAMARTAPLLTDRYRQATLAEAPVRGPGGDFAAWAAKGADTVAVDVTPQGSQGAAQGADAKRLVFAATQTAMHAGQNVGTAEQIVYVIVRQADDGTWAVSKIVTKSAGL